MSRGIKDLRDLICVSRLTVRDSEDEFISDDENNVGRLSQSVERKLSREVSALSLASTLDGSPTPRNDRVVSPDSGFVTNSSPSVGPSNSLTATSEIFLTEDGVFVTDIGEGDGLGLEVSKPPVGTAAYIGTRSQKKTKKKKKPSVLPTEPTRHELPKSQPLPPVSSIAGSPAVSEHELSFSSIKEKIDSAKNGSNKRKGRVGFDDMLTFMDATIVANWLTRSNTALQEMTSFVSKGDNFVKFAHFWLSDFPDLQKRDIFSMEFDFLLEELQLAFAVGRESYQEIKT